MSRYIDVDDIKMAMSLYGFSSPDQTITEFVEDTLPTADVQPVVRGEWIAEEIHNCWTEFECSVCKFKHKSVHNFGKPMTEFNYCPNCGARMVEE